MDTDQSGGVLPQSNVEAGVRWHHYVDWECVTEWALLPAAFLYYVVMPMAMSGTLGDLWPVARFVLLVSMPFLPFYYFYTTATMAERDSLNGYPERWKQCRLFYTNPRKR